MEAAHDERDAAEGGQLRPVTPPQPAAGSPLEALFDEIAADDGDDYLDLIVPRRAQQGVYVRYGIVDYGVIKRLFDPPDKVKKSNPLWELHASMDLLIRAGRGVFIATQEHGDVGFDRSNPSTDPDEWPVFDERTAATLNIPDADECGPRVVVKRLFVADGDIITAANRVSEWNGYDREDKLERTRGN